MDKVTRFVGMGVLLMLAGSCSTVSYVVDQDRDADFSTLRTFAWFELAEPARRPPPPAPAPANTLVSDRIRRSVTHELTAKGLEPAAVGEADLLVTFHVALRERLAVYHAGWGYPYGGRYWGPGYGWGGGPTTVRSYTEGSVVVDVLDAGRRQLIWRGIAEGALTRPNPTDEDIAKVVNRLMASFPRG